MKVITVTFRSGRVRQWPTSEVDRWLTTEHGNGGWLQDSDGQNRVYVSNFECIEFADELPYDTTKILQSLQNISDGLE